ncbi:MAG: phosphoribosylglycinamide formyltransferase [Clostridia bacterium]|nr:phosphoribosylglycinamide formyltransferase [Clostridia bacterium]
MKNIAVLVSGGGTNLQAVIDNTENGYIDGKVCVVISNKDGVYSIERAKKHNIPYVVVERKNFESEQAFNDKILEVLVEYNADVIALCGYLKILSEKIVKKYEKKIVNVHLSLIPKYCGMGMYGLKVHEAVLAAGEKETGATVHYVDENADTGEIIFQGTCPVDEGMSAEELQLRVMKIEHVLMPKAIKMLCEQK